MARLKSNRYGKTRVRLLQVLRGSAGHEVVEIEVSILFEGELSESYTIGDNSNVLPTDTMKNTVYALGRQNEIECIEEFGLVLGGHFLDQLAQVHIVKILIRQTPWHRIGSHRDAFIQSSKETRIAKLTIKRGTTSIVCGVRNLQILKTSRSAFAGYRKDEYTTLPETNDRLVGTVLDVDWTLSPETIHPDFNAIHRNVRAALLDRFAEHDSLSVQHTLYAMGEAVVATFEEIRDIHLTMPNKHCLLFDLSRFGLDNPNQIFVPTDEPSGFIEARVGR